MKSLFYLVLFGLKELTCCNICRNLTFQLCYEDDLFIYYSLSHVKGFSLFLKRPFFSVCPAQPGLV